MAKLYFKYGAMGSSKTANALICKFNYEERGFKVLLLKPEIDDRDLVGGNIVVRSRIGLSSPCIAIGKYTDLVALFNNERKTCDYRVIVIDECQFLTKEQVEQLKELSTDYTVLCYGLLTDFKTELFEGSKRLVELADSLQEIKSICKCGKKANINVRFVSGKITTDGDSVAIEKGNITYEPMCYACFLEEKKKQEADYCCNLHGVD
ncbi:MAG: thymidine kinase [Clostridia bacterium]|nr:thymidine kinase [Clostridia bacterium]